MKITAEPHVSRHIKHVVTEIVAPWGPSIEERPAVMSWEERMAEWQEKKDRQTERRKARRMGVVQGVVEGTAVAS